MRRRSGLRRVSRPTFFRTAFTLPNSIAEYLPQAQQQQQVRFKGILTARKLTRMHLRRAARQSEKATYLRYRHFGTLNV